EKLQPKLRFPEFSDSYYLKKLGDFSKIASGKSKKNESDTGYILYGSTDIVGHVDIPDYNGKSILVARVGANAGFLYMVDGNYGVTDNTLMVKELDENINYIFYLLKKENLNKFIFGSGQPLITGAILKNIKLNIPSLQEQ